MPRPGLYEDLITRALHSELAAMEAEGQSLERSRMQEDWLEDALARHVAGAVGRVLACLPKGKAGIEERARVVARVLNLLAEVDAEAVDLPGDEPWPGREALTWVGPADPGLGQPSPPERPQNGLVHPALLFNGARDTSLIHELRAELASADRVDAVIAFLKVSGLNLLRDALARFFERGGELRLLATTYVGATQRRAVDELVKLGGRVRVVYEDGSTRLHAKAWLFHRDSGLCTAYVGSSNLSRSALTDGAEWNVRVTRRRTPTVIERFETAFEQLWSDAATDYLADVHGKRLESSLRRARGDGDSSSDLALQHLILALEVAPKAHQELVLEALHSERARGHWSNLVVAATGTGKTWVSAFDYARLRSEGTVETLLFVAHRKEILEQSRQVFRLVLKDPGFGELWVDGTRPERGSHVFASVQSLRKAAIADWDPGAVDMLVIDEFHHAAAASYRVLLEHLRPCVRLGLTATPERMDGQDVLGWFEGRVASELRLWDALDEGLLAPFHYYGVFDPSSAERAWRRGRLDQGELDRLYTGDHIRAKRVLQAVGRYVAAPQQMHALGFCVGVGHAQLMARVFNEAGLAAIALHGEIPRAERREALQRLRGGQIRIIFTVDLFNEGVDIPQVDTVLFLRPTESATVFLQQLGRGLRHHPGKAQLVVVDFVGHVHQDYRYDVRYRAMVGGTLREVQRQVEREFPRLPAGCAIQLEEQAREVVLRSVKRLVGASGLRLLVEDLRALPPATSLATFLDRTGRELTDVFVPRKRWSWSQLRRRAGLDQAGEGEGEALMRARVGRLLHVDDPARLERWGRWLVQPSPPKLEALSSEDLSLARMLVVSLGEPRTALVDFQEELERVWSHDSVRRELVELVEVLADRVRHVTSPLKAAPFALHGTYTRREVVAALGVTSKGRLREHREGPLWIPERALDVFFVTLDKSDDVFRPSIRYADYPVSPTRFHWESQNRIHEGTPTGQRYIHHVERGLRVLFFLRERPKDADGETLPFVCCGFGAYLQHEGGRPMRMHWELEARLPPWVMQAGRMVGG